VNNTSYETLVKRATKETDPEIIDEIIRIIHFGRPAQRVADMSELDFMKNATEANLARVYAIEDRRIRP
jgi:hypothetical protein